MTLRPSGGAALWVIGTLLLLGAAPVTVDRLAARQTRDFKQRLEAARIDGMALRQAVPFHDECLRLQRRYGWTSSRSELAELEESLRRWVAVECSNDWMTEYSLVKARIESRSVAAGDYAQALKEWRQFGEFSFDPLFKARIDAETTNVDRLSREAAEILVRDAGTGPDARGRMEEAEPRFSGTEGMRVLHSALKPLGPP